MENTIGNKAGTPEEKARFFALYLGQDVMVPAPATNTAILTGNALSSYMCMGVNYLSLRSIESLNETELRHIAELLGHKVYAGDKFMRRIVNGAWINQPMSVVEHIISYLRSIGVLIPFMGYTEAEIISMGWAKIKTT